MALPPRRPGRHRGPEDLTPSSSLGPKDPLGEPAALSAQAPLARRLPQEEEEEGVPPGRGRLDPPPQGRRARQVVVVVVVVTPKLQVPRSPVGELRLSLVRPHPRKASRAKPERCRRYCPPPLSRKGPVLTRKLKAV